MKLISSTFFTEETFFKKTFSKLDGAEQIISKIDFEKCKFVKCVFQKTFFKECSFTDCTFEESDLSLLNVSNSSFNNISFKNCKAIGVDWTKSKREILPISLSLDECKINLSSFNGLTIEKLKIINCSAKEVDFRESILKEVDFSYSNLEKSIFHNTDLTSANFTQAKNYSIDFNNNKIEKSIHSVPRVISLLKPLNIKIENLES